MSSLYLRVLGVISTDLRDLIGSCLLRLYVVLLSLGNLSLPVTVTTTRDLTASMLGLLGIVLQSFHLKVNIIILFSFFLISIVILIIMIISWVGW